MDAICWVWEILEPFLRGAARHPNEALFQKGSRIVNMATSYHDTFIGPTAEYDIPLLYQFLLSGYEEITPPTWFPPTTIAAFHHCLLQFRHTKTTAKDQ